ncbi:SDR family oxidoreductase [Streptomyces sp. NPDC005727]|uniref:SDR family oxidoreductase n=1 Tax=Streptomyces sp. NPDC005727 TaxID=3157053 RepID=UPI003411A223
MRGDPSRLERTEAMVRPESLDPTGPAWPSRSARSRRRGDASRVISAGYIPDSNFFHGQLSDKRRRALVEETHNKRPGTVDDIAYTAYFLASPGARHITGQTIHVNGGAFTTR